jgi:opacity protein-like surface antigen
MKCAFKNALRAALVLVFVTGLAKPASADWLLTPYLGVVFSGAANTIDLDDFDETFAKRANFGVSLAARTDRIIGFEIDYNLTPNFFQISGSEEDIDFFGLDSNLTTLMGNVIVGIPIGGSTGAGVRPYVAGGAGLMRAKISAPDFFDDLSTNDLGINLGGGVHVFFTDNLGLRGDLRYFRGLEQTDDDDPVEDDDFFDEDFGLEDFDYWRLSVGLTFRFGR